MNKPSTAHTKEKNGRGGAQLLNYYDEDGDEDLNDRYKSNRNDKHRK
jgi:hypothetical protein